MGGKNRALASRVIEAILSGAIKEGEKIALIGPDRKKTMNAPGPKDPELTAKIIRFMESDGS